MYLTIGNMLTIFNWVITNLLILCMIVKNNCIKIVINK